MSRSLHTRCWLAKSTAAQSTFPAHGADWSDLDPLEFERFRHLATASNADLAIAELEGMDICRALGVVHVQVDREEEVEFGLLRVPFPLVPETQRARPSPTPSCIATTPQWAVRVEITDETFTVTSPGGFPLGVRLDNLLTMSQPRSPILADAFRRAGIVDRSGCGINKMHAALLRIGRDAPDYSRSSGRRRSAR